MLAVAFCALRAVLTATFDEVNDFFAFNLGYNFSLNSRASHERRPNGDTFATNHQDIIELDFVSSFGSQFFNAQHIACLHFILLAACFQDREHGLSFLLSRLVVPTQSGADVYYRGLRAIMAS